MPAIRPDGQVRKQRYLNDAGSNHGKGRPDRQAAQRQKLKVGHGIEDAGLDAGAAGGKDAAQP